MRFAALMENDALSPAFCRGFGLSLYFETPRRRILFDAGPDGGFSENAERLGFDLEAVDLAVLSHGHSDHSDGLLEFFRRNRRAPVYLHAGAEGSYYAKTPEGTRYIGMDPALKAYQDRFRVVEGTCRLDEELTLFDGAGGDFPTMDTSGRLKALSAAGELEPDAFSHEQYLLIQAEGKTVLAAGCAHRGIVNILRRGEAVAGRSIDAAVGGFHLFQLDAADPSSDRLLQKTGEALAAGKTVYYTGHCTGEYPYRVLRQALGDRLRRFAAGSVEEL